MDKELEKISVDFNNKAQKLLFQLFDKFRSSARRIDRQKDENVFQQMQGKYLYTMKQQLELIAKELIYKNTSLKNTEHLNKVLTDEINLYLNEFRQKSRSL